MTDVDIDVLQHYNSFNDKSPKERKNKMKRLKGLIALFLAVLVSLSVFTFAVPASAGNAKEGEITKVYCVSKGIKLTWNKASGADRYEVFRYRSGDTEWKTVATVTGTSYTDKKVSYGSTYYYAIKRCFDSAPEKNKYSEQKSMVYLDSPTVTEAKLVSGGIKIKWSAVSGADSYLIYRSANGGKFKKIATVRASKKLTHTDKNVKNGVTYTYALRAANGDSKSLYSSAKKSAVYLKTPVLVSVKNSPKGVTVTWHKSTAPQGYEILRKTGKGEWKKAGRVDSSKKSFIDKKASYGKECTYKVRAYKGEAQGFCSNKISVRALDPKKKAIALTWDDGPYTPVTNQILDCLEKNNARATFFIVGSRADTYKDCIKREAALGCEVATHTYNHANLTKLTGDEIKKEISDGVKAIEKYSGKGTVKLVRTPGGAVNDTVRANVKYPMINWSVDTLDWQHRTTEKTVANIKAQARDGSIVLMHDLYVATGNAAVQIIPWLTEQGYQLVTVSELFELKGIDAKAGQLYTHG